MSVSFVNPVEYHDSLRHNLCLEGLSWQSSDSQTQMTGKLKRTFSA